MIAHYNIQVVAPFEIIVKAKVRVHEYTNGTLAIFHGPRKLAEYDKDGNEVNLKSTKTEKQPQVDHRAHRNTRDNPYGSSNLCTWGQLG